MKQETIEEASHTAWLNYEHVEGNLYSTSFKNGFLDGAKWQQERMYSEEDMIRFAEFVASYPDKNKNINGQILHAKSKYDGAERTIDLFSEWIKQFKKK